MQSVQNNCIVVSSSGDRRRSTDRIEMQKGGGGGSSSAAVVRMGPCGGDGGGGRDMDMRGVGRVVRVAVRHGAAVDAMSVLYERNGHEEWTDLWGGPGGTLSEISLQPGEYLTSVAGHYGRLDGDLVVRSLTFVSNMRAYGPFGQEDGGVAFDLPAAGGGKILGFHARSGRRLDAVGTYVKIG
uniref:Jacalin-type lectin domain-containing protein n=1 Tax=Oryza meridionalis TaxID=40149 RepID=A0A0E0CEC2_9ORYZ